MDYTPRHPQPFTLEQAILLDVTVLSEGGAVSSSIHLTFAYIPGTARDNPSPELSAAPEENTGRASATCSELFVP
jgi:hypothetical protein